MSRQRLAAISLACVLVAGGAWLYADLFQLPRGSAPQVDGEGRLAIAQDPSEGALVAPSEATNAPHAQLPVHAAHDDWRVPDDAIWIEGRVIYPPNTPEDEHVVIIARGRRFGDSDRRKHEVTPSADGRFRVAFSAASRSGSLRLEASYLYLERAVRLKFDNLPDEVLVEPRIRNLVTLFGCVTAGGEPAILVPIEVESRKQQRVRTQHTDRDGRYEVVVDDAGTHLITFDGWGPTFEIEVPEGTRAHRRDFDLPTGRIAGKVIGPDGTPASRVAISIKNSAERESEDHTEGRSAVVVDGTFSFERVWDGTFVLRAGSDLWFNDNPAFGNVILEDLSIEGGSAIEGLIIQLPRAGTIEGQVNDADGSPVHARIELFDSKGRPMIGPRTSSDAAGRYVLRGIGVGTFAIRAALDEEQSAEKIIHVPEGGVVTVELTLQRR